MNKPVCVVLGVGPGNGEAFARKFSEQGYALALLSRSPRTTEKIAGELPDSRYYECDAADPASIQATFANIRKDLGEVDVLIYNAGSGVFGNPEETSLDDFENAWKVNALGGLAAAKEVLPKMKSRGAGSIVFIGATASLRGGAKFTAFASAKAAQRNMAQSLARHLWPAGVHVALLIIDGMVDLPRTRQMVPDKDDSFFLKPAEIAETVWNITQQPKSAWSFEVDVRPFGETW